MMSLPLLLIAAHLAAAPAPAPAKPAKKARPSAAAVEEGERRMARGAAGVRTAASPAELKDAAAEFEAAAAANPELNDAFYNAGVTYAKAGDHAAAVRNLKRYAETAKGAELKAAKAKLAEEEFLLEKEQKAQTKLAGTWGYVFDGAVSYSFGKLTRELQSEALGQGRYRLRLARLSGTPTHSEESFEFTLDGDKLTGTFRWDGLGPTTGKRLCDAVSSPLSGELKNGDTLEFRYQSRMFETGCGTTTPTDIYKKVP